MGKYQKKPIVIEALQFTGDNIDEITAFIGNTRQAVIKDENGYPTAIIIKTLEGNHRASLNDWIIKGIKNEFYPCKPDIFKATYEKIHE